MQIEFHYYITYILARRAGFTKQDATLIAYASQYTDDNNTEYILNKGTTSEYCNYISQTMDISKPQNQRMRIYPCFHFIPGDFTCDCAKRQDGNIHRYNTTPNSANAIKIVEQVFATYNLHHIGICLHSYADTWAHQNFVGCKDDFNSCMGLLEAFIPNIGHADAMHAPDNPALIWTDKRLVEKTVSNKTRFLAAAEAMYFRLFKYAEPDASDDKISIEWKRLRTELSLCIGAESNNARNVDENRISRYVEIAEDINDYDCNEWLKLAIDQNGMKSKSGFEQSDWFMFQEAVKKHQDLVWHTVMGQLAEIGDKWVNDMNF